MFQINIARLAALMKTSSPYLADPATKKHYASGIQYNVFDLAEY